MVTIKYRLCYSDNSENLREFEDEKEASWFINNEGDHLVFCERIEDDLVYRLKKRAEIRRQISTRKSVQEGKPDRIADLLEEAALVLDQRNAYIRSLQRDNKELRKKTNEVA